MKSALVGIGLALAGPAHAAGAPGLSVSITLPAGAQTQTDTYRCGAKAPFAVTYINAGPNQLALVPVGGVRRVMVASISADGVRYVSGRYQWWTKGREATLKDRMSKRPGQACKSARH